MRAFFLIFLLLYLSLFPSASPTPVVEIIEEELVVHSAETLNIKKLVPEKKPSPEFPVHLSLTPQTDLHPELRPPARAIL